jgi:hypothetical protein
VHGVHTTNPQATHAAERPWFGGLVGLRAGGSGAGIAPEPIDTRKKKESRASMDRTLSVMQCPTLFGLF